MFKSNKQRGAYFASQEDKGIKPMKSSGMSNMTSPMGMQGIKKLPSLPNLKVKNTLPELNPISKMGGFSLLKNRLKMPKY